MNKLLITLIILTFPSLTWGNQRFNGICAASGNVTTSGLTSTNTADLTYASATVTVSVVGGGTATIFSDNAGTPLANPFTANSDSTFSFYAANGRYTAVCSGAGIPTITISDNLLNDPAAAFASSNLVVPEGTCSGAASGFDVLCAKSATHFFSISLNGGAFNDLNPVAIGGDLGGTPSSPTVVSTHISGGTNNTLPKFNSTGNLVNTSITDSGTNVISAENLQMGLVNNFYFVDGSKYTTIQSAITAACGATPSGGTVFIPPGTYAQGSTPFTLCSNLKIVGSGSCQVDMVNCPTMITTTITGTTDLFPFSGVNDAYLSDVGIKNIGAGGGTAIHLVNAQRNVIERFYISGPFNVGVLLSSSSASTSSTIWNKFSDFHCTGLANSGVGLELNSADASTKVINGNSFWNDHCTGGNSGKAVWLTNSVQLQVINEDILQCTECSATSGTGIQIDQGSTRGLILIQPNAEGSTNGFVKQTANTVTIIGGNFQSNTTQVTDSQPAFSMFLGTNVSGTVQNLGIDPAGDIIANGLSFASATPTANSINGPSGMMVEALGNGALTIHASDVTLGQQLILGGHTFSNGGGTLTFPTTTGTMAQTNVAQTFSAAQQFTAISNNTGIQMFTTSTTCTTGAGVGDTCTTSAISLPVAYSDSNYRANCTGNTPTAVPVISSIAKSNGSFTLTLAALTAAGASYGNFDCIVSHN